MNNTPKWKVVIFLAVCFTVFMLCSNPDRPLAEKFTLVSYTLALVCMTILAVIVLTSITQFVIFIYENIQDNKKFAKTKALIAELSTRDAFCERCDVRVFENTEILPLTYVGPLGSAQGVKHLYQIDEEFGQEIYALPKQLAWIDPQLNNGQIEATITTCKIYFDGRGLYEQVHIAVPRFDELTDRTFDQDSWVQLAINKAYEKFNSGDVNTLYL